MAESKGYTPSSKYAKVFEGGSLFLRKDGYLMFQKYETDENGKYRRMSFTGKTEEQIAKKYKEFLKRVKEIRRMRQQESYQLVTGTVHGLKPPAGIDMPPWKRREGRSSLIIPPPTSGFRRYSPPNAGC